MKINFFLATLLSGLVFLMASSGIAYAQTATIAQLKQEIALLEQLLAQQQGTQSSCYTFNTNLGFAQSNTNDVIQLHSDLQKEGFSYNPDDISVYSTGTSEAVIQFQTKYGIIPQSGYVGIKTRTELNNLYGCNSTNTNNCQATCVTQSDGIYAVDCSGSTTKCDQGDVCQETYDNSYNYNNGSVQTVQNLTGSECVAPTSGCTPNWQCTAWNTCYTGQQTRTCADTNYCRVSTGEPATTQSCTVCQAACTGGYAVDCSGNATQCESGQYCQLTYNTTNTYLNGMLYTTSPVSGSECVTPCTPDWQCSGFGDCINGQQTQTCTDYNNCGVATNEPATTQSCTSN